jgi:sulfate/thiosulfate transport system permease protein
MADASAIRRGTAVASESPFARTVLIAFTVGFLGLFLIAPLIVVAAEASRKGLSGYFSAIGDPDARAAIALTLMVAAIVVPINAALGDRRRGACRNSASGGRAPL